MWSINSCAIINRIAEDGCRNIYARATGHMLETRTRRGGEQGELTYFIRYRKNYWLVDSSSGRTLYLLEKEIVIWH